MTPIEKIMMLGFCYGIPSLVGLWVGYKMFIGILFVNSLLVTRKLPWKK